MIWPVKKEIAIVGHGIVLNWIGCIKIEDTLNLAYQDESEAAYLQDRVLAQVCVIGHSLQAFVKEVRLWPRNSLGIRMWLKEGVTFCDVQGFPKNID